MQEKFVLKAKTAIKRVAAMSTGALMLGATALGAVAAYDLGDYPAPFVSGGTWSGLVVVGSGANAADIVGATDIIGRLTQESVSSVSGTGTISITGGTAGKAYFGDGIANSTIGDAIDFELEDDDISTLIDSEITFNSTEYDVREMIKLDQNSPVVHTSLTGSDDDYITTPYMEVAKGAIQYYYLFDKSISIKDASTTTPVDINFLGKKLKITSVADDNTFTAQVGTEYFMNVGDSVTSEGKTVTLVNVGSTGTVVVDVDGTQEAISGTETINGIEVTRDDFFYSDTTAERSATLIVGTDATQTYDDGDEYTDYCATKWKSDNCKKTNPDWKWIITDLNESNTWESNNTDDNAYPSLGVENSYIVNGDDDNPITVGGCYDLPNDFAEICFDSLTTNDYMDVSIRLELDQDLSDYTQYSTKTSEPTIYIESSVEDSLELQSAGIGGLSADTKVEKVWVWLNDSNPGNVTEIFYLDSNNDFQRAGNVSWHHATANNYFLGISYGSTKDNNILIGLGNNSVAAGTDFVINMTIDVDDDDGDFLPESADDLNMNWTWTVASSGFSSLGASVSTNEAGELAWSNKMTDISQKDEDHMTKYGIIVKDPKNNGGGDEVRLQIPSDQVKANVIVKGSGATVSSSGGAVQINSIAGVDLIKLDTEVTSKTAKPMIIVGGPCINTLAAEAMFGSPAAKCGASSGIPENKAIIQLVENAFGGTNVALVVAGWEAANTREAANILKDYSTYTAQLTGKTKVQVSGTSVTAVSDTSTVA